MRRGWRATCSAYLKHLFLKMPRIIFSIILTALVWHCPARGESPADAKAVAVLVDEIVAQQKVIAENQLKIDKLMADLAEEIRLARIFVSRSGGRSK